MSARHDLARMIMRHCCAITDVQALKAASVAISSGYRKPRSITTRAELNALPIGAVILTEDEVAYQTVAGHYGRYPLPVLVLHEPVQ